MRPAAVGLCLLVFAVGVSCTEDGGGTSGGGKGGVASVRAAADAARAAGTVRTSVDVTLDPGPVLTENHGEGGFDFAGDAGTLSVRAKTGAIEQPIELIVLGSDLYSRYPENSPKWYRQDWEGGLMQPGLAPAEWLDLLAAADDDDVTAEGTEEVGDASTTRYVVDLSYEEIVDAVDEELEERLADLAPTVEFEPFEVWIDDEGLPRRLRVTATMEQPDSTIDFVGTLELYDYGADVTIEPPDEFEEG